MDTDEEDMVRDRYGNQFIWQVRWRRYIPFVHTFYQRDTYLDGGSVTWCFGWLMVCKWIVYSRVRWQIRWDPHFTRFFDRYIFRDDGSVGWHIGFVTVYRWVGQAAEDTSVRESIKPIGWCIRVYDKGTNVLVRSTPIKEPNFDLLADIYGSEDDGKKREFLITEDVQRKTALVSKPDFERYRYYVAIEGV